MFSKPAESENGTYLGLMTPTEGKERKRRKAGK